MCRDRFRRNDELAVLISLLVSVGMLAGTVVTVGIFANQVLGGYPLIRLILSSVIIFDWVWHKFGTVIKDQRPFPFGWVLLQSEGGFYRFTGVYQFLGR